LRASVQDRGLVVEGPKDGTAKDTLVQQARYYATRSRKQRGIKMGWDSPGRGECRMCACLSSSQQARKWFAARTLSVSSAYLEVLLCRGTWNLKPHFGGGEAP
jgi:hypothetical protein